MNSMNRREFPRISVRLKCRLDSCGDWARSWCGTTENISRAGVLMTCSPDELPPPSVGEAVSVEIELPWLHSFGPKCIHCQASVVRVIENGPRFTVALCADQMQFRTFGERLQVSTWIQPGLLQ